MSSFEGKPVSSTIWSALLDKAYRVLASSDSFDHSKVESLWSHSFGVEISVCPSTSSGEISNTRAKALDPIEGQEGFQH